MHRRALRTPTAERGRDGNVSLDYATLNVAAAAVARELGAPGLSAGQAVAVALPRSWRLVCVMLGILRLERGSCPWTPQSPAERRRLHPRRLRRGRPGVRDSGSASDLPQDVKALASDALLPDRATATAPHGAPVP